MVPSGHLICSHPLLHSPPPLKDLVKASSQVFQVHLLARFHHQVPLSSLAVHVVCMLHSLNSYSYVRGIGKPCNSQKFLQRGTKPTVVPWQRPLGCTLSVPTTILPGAWAASSITFWQQQLLMCKSAHGKPSQGVFQF